MTWVWTFLLLTIGGQATQIADRDLTDRMVAAARIHTLVQQYFAHWDGVARSDIETAYRKYVADVLATTDRNGFDLPSLRFTAALHNAHTQFLDERADARPLKFRLLEV